MVIQSLSAFSQIDTTKVVLSVDVARKVATDLVEGDFAKDRVDTLERIVYLQDSLIAHQKSQNTYLEQQLGIQKTLLTYSEAENQDKLQTIESLDKQLKKQQQLSTGLRIGGVTLTVGLLVLLLVK